MEEEDKVVTWQNVRGSPPSEGKCPTKAELCFVQGTYLLSYRSCKREVTTIVMISWWTGDTTFIFERIHRFLSVRQETQFYRSGRKKGQEFRTILFSPPIQRISRTQGTNLISTREREPR